MKNSSQDECKQISPNHKQLTRLCASLRKQNSNIMECQAMKMQQTQFPISNSNSSFQFPIPISNANFQVQFPMPISNSNFQRYNFQFNSNSQKEPAPPRSRWRAPITPSCRASRGSHTARRFALRPLIFFSDGRQSSGSLLILISHVQPCVACVQTRKATVGA